MTWFCAKCGRYIPASEREGAICPYCGQVFCKEHIHSHGCFITNENLPDIKVGDIVRVEGRDGLYEVISVQTIESPRGRHLKIGLRPKAGGSPFFVISPPVKIIKIPSLIDMIRCGKFPEGHMIKFDLFVEAVRFSYIHQYDPLLSLSVTKIDPVPHQIEAVYRMLEAFEPRFLLADDTGLGKTIMTGMLIKELKLRGRLKRVLIVVPPALQDQWQRELYRFFGEYFRKLSSREALRSYGPHINPWMAENQVITSIDFVKQEDILKGLRETTWDMIVFDEAHKLAAYKSGRNVRYTKRYKFADAMKGRTKCLLLLTATPHSGDEFAFFKLVSLVDPYLFPSEYDIDRSKLRRVMIRRLKEEVTDLNGRPLFPPREARTLYVDFTEMEKAFYDELTSYVRYYFNMAKQARNRGVAFAMTILQRRMASSIYAIKKSLENRRARLQDLLEGKKIELTREDWEIIERYRKSPEDVDEAEIERVRKKLEALTMAANKEQLKMEIEQVDRLLRMVEDIMAVEKPDSKAKALLKFIDDVLERNPREKILIFTEYRDTMEYIKNLLEERGYRVAYIHGEMPFDQRVQQEELFGNPEGASIMVATDAASEGLNLQFCHILVNYELPWNPNRLEQRIGRLHRYGQRKKVFVHNLMVRNSVEDRVLKRLLDKLETIRREIGDRVFDVLGMLFSVIDWEKVIMDVISGADWEPIVQEIEAKIEERKQEIIESIERKFLTKDRLDFSFILELLGKSKEHAITEHDMERFVRRFLAVFGGRLLRTEKPGVFRLQLPKRLKDEGLQLSKEVTFSKEIAKEDSSVEFLALGHPVIDKMIEICKQLMPDGQLTVKLSPRGEFGVFFAFKGKIVNGFTGETKGERLFTLFYDADRDEVRQVNSRCIWDWESCDEEEIELPEEIISRIDDIERKARGEAIKLLQDYEDEVRRKVEREVRIKREDVIEYFNKKIAEAEERIKQYRSKLPIKDIEIAIRREEANIRRFKEEQDKQLKRLEEELALIAEQPPELLAIAIVVPKKGRISIERIREVEQAGMEAVMEYERSRGREPEDVSHEFRGYDIISKDGRTGEILRRIEVKAFAGKATNIEMTSNEWRAAQVYGDQYWLYIVEYATDPNRRTITLIRNPYSVLKDVAKLKRITEFKVVIKDWREVISSRQDIKEGA